MDSLHIFILKMSVRPAPPGMTPERNRLDASVLPVPPLELFRLMPFILCKVYRAAVDVENASIHMPAALAAIFLIHGFGVLPFERGHIRVAKAHKVTFHIFSYAGDAAKVSCFRLRHGVPLEGELCGDSFMI